MPTIAKVLKVAYWKTTSAHSSSKTITGILNDLGDAYEANEGATHTTSRSKTVAGALARSLMVIEDDVADYDAWKNQGSIEDKK